MYLIGRCRCTSLSENACQTTPSKQLRAAFLSTQKGNSHHPHCLPQIFQPDALPKVNFPEVHFDLIKYTFISTLLCVYQ